MTGLPQHASPEEGGRRLFRRNLAGWYLYDCGQSAFSTSVITVFFGPFITSLARSAANGTDRFDLLGVPLHPGAYYPYLISASVVLQILLLPVMGVLADHIGRKKEMLGAAAVAGGVAVCGFLFAEGATGLLLAGGLFVLANLAFGIADVLYGALLGDISMPEERDAVSSTGWGVGYFVSGLLLLGQYLFLGSGAAASIGEEDAVRLCLLTSGLWWILCTILFLRIVRVSRRRADAGRRLPPITAGFRQLAATLKSARRHPQTLLFLLAYLVYSDGIQTVTSVATQFGQEEVGLGMEELAQVILIVQFVGVLGAFLFLRIARMLGTKRSIMLTLVIYAAITVYTYAWVSTPGEFYVMASLVALVLVGSQALSRSLYSRIIPEGHEAAYFSLFEVSERGTSWSGPLVFGMALQYTQSYRLAVLALAWYFIIGLAILGRVNVDRAVESVEGERNTPAPEPAGV